MAPEMGAVEAEQEMGQTFQSLDEAIEAVRAASAVGSRPS